LTHWREIREGNGEEMFPRAGSKYINIKKICSLSIVVSSTDSTVWLLETIAAVKMSVQVPLLYVDLYSFGIMPKRHHRNLHGLLEDRCQL
jgi:hypothetical protein